jgi:hypothetical protein
MSAALSNGTKHLWQHLARCNAYLSKNKQSLLKMTSEGPLNSTWIFNQSESRELLTKLIIADERPFTLVEHPIFKAFIQSLKPKFKLFGQTTIKKDVMEMYQAMKKNALRKLEDTK